MRRGGDEDGGVQMIPEELLTKTDEIVAGGAAAMEQYHDGLSRRRVRANDTKQETLMDPFEVPGEV